MKYFKKLVGERIYLSPRNAEDAEIFVKWLNDFQVSDYIGQSSKLYTINDEKAYLDKESLETSRAFVIVTLDSNKMVGIVSLENINGINRTATLGIFIGEAEYRDNGYGTEAIRLLLDYGFNYLNLNNIKLNLMSFNERALACYKKCGFKEYGRRRKCVFVSGKYYDEISMDILAEEFKDKQFIKNKNI